MKEYSFAVIGDFHYARRSHYPEKLSGDCKVTIYEWMVRYILKPMLSEIKASHPEFIIQTGDFVEGMIKDYEQAKIQLKEALNLLSFAKVPVYISIGGHDKYTIPTKAYKDVVMPFLSRNLKQELKNNYFSFNYRESKFIFLDTQEFGKADSQLSWLEKELENCQKKEHIFVFGHQPLFLIARAFFSEIKFIKLMLKLFENYPIDAYFCGHTHNQSVLLSRNEKILQIKGVAVGFPENKSIPSRIRKKMEKFPSGIAYYIPDEELIPLEEVRTLLLSRDSLYYYWGYLEDTAPGWYLVKVKGKRVIVEWHLVGRGIQRIFSWVEPGKIEDIKVPRRKAKEKIDEADLDKIKSAYLYLSLWNSKTTKKKIFLNEEKIGFVPKGTSYSTQRIEIPENKLSVITLKNRIRINNPDKEEFCVGSIYMELILRNNMKIRSAVSRDIHTTSREWNSWKLGLLRYTPPAKDIFQEIEFKTR